MKEISDDLITRGMQIMPKFEAEARLQLLNSDDLVMWSNYTYTAGNGNCSFKTIFFCLSFFFLSWSEYSGFTMLSCKNQSQVICNRTTELTSLDSGQQ